MWEPQPPGTLRACKGLYSGCFILVYYIFNNLPVADIIHCWIRKDGT